MSRVGVTAVVVSRGLDALLVFALDHLREALSRLDGGGHAIVVVDHASETPYRPGYLGRDVVLHRLDRHTSFARANNQGAALRPNDFILLLNNDVFLHREALRCAMALLARVPRGGICGSRLLFPDGRIQHCGVAFAAGREGPYHFARGRPAWTVARANREWQAVTGACFLVRREVWDTLGGLDESYPFGLEDVDFCLRARQVGWRVFCCDDVDSLHLESVTPGRAMLDRRSRRLFLDRWQGRWAIDG